MQVGPDFISAVEQVLPNKDEVILVGCAAGVRSLLAIQVLGKAGYTNLRNVEEGFQGWAARGLPIDK